MASFPYVLWQEHGLWYAKIAEPGLHDAKDVLVGHGGSPCAAVIDLMQKELDKAHA